MSGHTEAIIAIAGHAVSVGGVVGVLVVHWMRNKVRMAQLELQVRLLMKHAGLNGQGP